MKTRMMKAALCGSLLVVMGLGANTAHAATTTADAKARILSQITVSKVSGQDLDFGAIVSGASASTVQISTAGSRTCGAGITCSGTTSAAGFSITGTTGETVTIGSDANVTLNGPGGATMSATLASSLATLTLDGSDGFTVGGTLGVNASQAAGNYSGTFNVTVNYQ